jgi:hypothetical protein
LYPARAVCGVTPTMVGNSAKGRASGDWAGIRAF